MQCFTVSIISSQINCGYEFSKLWWSQTYIALNIISVFVFSILWTSSLKSIEFFNLSLSLSQFEISVFENIIIITVLTFMQLITTESSLHERLLQHNLFQIKRFNFIFFSEWLDISICQNRVVNFLIRIFGKVLKILE